MNRREQKRAKNERRRKAKLNRDRRSIPATNAQVPRPAHEKPRPATICRDCQATNDPGASECWLCGRRDWRGPPTSSATKPIAETTFASAARLMPVVETVLIVLALAVVGAGVVRLAPGLGIAFLIFLVPAWVITEKTARNRNTPMSAPRKFAKIVWWAIVIPVLLAISLPILVLFACAAVIGVMA